MPVNLYGFGDLVVCSNVITFVSSPKCEQAMSSVVRCARKGGWVMLVQPSLESHDHVTRLETRTAPLQRGGIPRWCSGMIFVSDFSVNQGRRDWLKAPD